MTDDDHGMSPLIPSLNEPAIGPPPAPTPWSPPVGAAPPPGVTVPAPPSASDTPPSTWGQPAPSAPIATGGVHQAPPGQPAPSSSGRNHGRGQGRGRLLVALVVLAGVGGGAGWWFLLRDDPDAGLPSVEADRAALGTAVAAAGSANALRPSAEDSATIAGLDLVERRGTCDAAPVGPPEERAGVVRAFAPSDPASLLPVSAAVGAFSFRNPQDASEFVLALGANLEVCAPGSVTDAQPPDGLSDALARQVGVPLAGIEVPTRFVVADRDRFVVVAAGVDAAQIDAVLAGLLDDIGS